ncbi:MAG: hypothetical protein KC776_27665 [Myxococcales bacterium]|nr:hypothetical protein [Myxococcales bacterium]MCB9576472.1 hypothetical protein [Polyangiaceae bacterium]
MSKHRLVWLFRLLLLTPATAGCVVPAARYEEARSAVSVEQEANRRMLAQLRDIDTKLEQANAGLREREQQLEKKDQRIAELSLQSSVAEQEKTDASDLVEQLRGELGRVGDHLKAFAEDKKRLSEALSAAEQREKRLSEAEQLSSETGALIRDMSLLLHDAVGTGDVELEVDNGRVVLRIPRDGLTGEKLSATADKSLTALGRIASLHPKARFEINDALGQSEPASPKLPATRVKSELSARGVPAERVGVRTPSGDGIDPAEAGEAGMVEIYVSV